MHRPVTYSARRMPGHCSSVTLLRLELLDFAGAAGGTKFIHEESTCKLKVIDFLYHHGPTKNTYTHRHKIQQEITLRIYSCTDTQNQELNIKISSQSFLISSDLPDLCERPPHKLNSKSSLTSFDLLTQKQQRNTKMNNR